MGHKKGIARIRYSDDPRKETIAVLFYFLIKDGSMRLI